MTPVQQPPVSDGNLARFFEWIASAIGGALIALVTFRTRLALMDQRHARHEEDRQALKESIDRRLELIDRRQHVTLELLADIAKALKIENRFSDALVRFLSDDPEGR